MEAGNRCKDENLPDVMKDDIAYDWDKDDSDNEELDDDAKKTNHMYKSQKRIDKKKEEDEKKAKEKAEKGVKESEFSKKCKDIKQKMDDLHMKSETEITFELGKKFEANTNLAWDYDQTFKFGWQFPFCLPAIPCIQFRIGIKVEIYFKITIGLQISFKVDKENKEEAEIDFNINPFLETSVGIKLDITAQVGAFTGFIDASAGIDGTLLDAKAEIKLYFYLLKGNFDFYVSIKISCLQFRVYADVIVRIWVIFHTFIIKKSLFEKSFGLNSPLVHIYYYLKKDFNGQVLEEKSS